MKSKKELEKEIDALNKSIEAKKKLLEEINSAEKKNIDLESYNGKFFYSKSGIRDSYISIEQVIGYNSELNAIEARGKQITIHLTMMSLDYTYHSGSVLLPLNDTYEEDSSGSCYIHAKDRIVKTLTREQQ